MPDYYRLGQKHAEQALGVQPRPQDRSYLKDFMAGVDPTGTYTTEYGMADVGTDTNNTARQMTGVAGGVLGGGLVIPSAISGIMNMGKGTGLKGKARAFGQGFIDPVRQISHGFKAKKILKNAPEAGISQPDAHFLRGKIMDVTPEGLRPRFMEEIRGTPEGLRSRLMEKIRGTPEGLRSRLMEKMVDVTPEGLRSRLRKKMMDVTPEVLRPRLMEEKAKTFLTPEEFRAIPKETVGGINQFIDDEMKSTAAGMGLGGAFSAGSAYAQYGKGRDMGQKVDQRTRDVLTE